MHRSAWVVLVVICMQRQVALGAPIDIAIIYNDDEVDALVSGLQQYNDFGNIDLISWSVTPNPALLTPYDAVVVTDRYKPVANSAGWGNVVADYAESGGGVVLGFAFFSTGGPAVDFGRLEDADHSPFRRGGIVPGDTSLGEILIPSHPLMTDINELETHYRYDVVDHPGATVVANFHDGYPVAGYMDVGSGRVVGIQMAYKEDPYFTNRGDFMQLYRNAVVYSVPEPATLSLLTLGGWLITRRKRR